MANDPLIGKVLQGTYELTRLIGQGGMGSVYEAAHARVDRRFAIKVLHCSMIKDEVVMARFKREAMLGSRLGHDHIVPVLDFDHTDDGNPYLVMELLEGLNLGKVMRDEGAMPLVRACSVIRQICRALSAAHAEGVVHRDLKPDNIFLCQRQGGGEQVMVMDFGISKVLSSESILTARSAVMGTPWYMSPEQAAGKTDRVDHRSDIFSLGILFYQMLSGERPFVGDSIPRVLYQVVTHTPPPLDQVRPGLPAGVTALVERAMRKKRDARCQSVDKFVADLARALGQRWTEVMVAELGSSDDEAPIARQSTGSSRATLPFPPPPREPSQPEIERCNTEVSTAPPAEVNAPSEEVIKPPPAPRASLLVEASADGEPLNAEIFLDGERMERTPAEIHDLEPGRHTLRLVCEGYRPMSRSVVLSPGSTESVKATLFPR